VLSDALDLPDRTHDEVRLAAALHDVGKIGVPDTILLKPSSLTPDEYVVMQRHSQIGYQLLAESDSHLLALAATVALEHHEWWDGSGYPHGRHEEEISPEARVAAVADVFDALTSHRVYRAAMTVDDAVAVMTELRGQQFEPRALDAFLDSLGEFAAIRAEHPEQEDVGRIRILIVDDHEIFVQSLVRVLGGQPDMRVVGTAGTVAEAIRAAAAYEPDVVLMDFELPDGDGAHATRMIHTLLPAVQVVLLTGRADRDAAVRAIAAGCAGFVNKTESIDMLAAAIRDAAEGEAPMSIADLPRLLTQLRPTKRGIGDDLGDRQLEVLRLMAAGLPNKLIAARLHISINTVRNHVQNILGKLDAHSKLEAVATAVREGILERDSRISTG
jgi:response regulator RpfG family c-di-GMP phosphodiesterase/DNA-binding CsgD family transcriptional regulator